MTRSPLQALNNEGENCLSILSAYTGDESVVSTDRPKPFLHQPIYFPFEILTVAMNSYLNVACVFLILAVLYCPNCRADQPTAAGITNGNVAESDNNSDNNNDNAELEQSRLLKYLYSLALNKAESRFQNEISQKEGTPNNRLYLSPKWFLEDNSYWAKYNNLKKRAPCLLNAGLSHGCDMMDFLAAKHQQSKFADFAGPGK